jgi:hypothetical protein
MAWRLLAGIHGRMFPSQKPDDSSKPKCVLPRSEVYLSSPFKKVAGKVQGPGRFLKRPVDPCPHPYSLPTPTDGELSCLLLVPLALGHLDSIQEYQSAIYTSTTCYQISEAGLRASATLACHPSGYLDDQTNDGGSKSRSIPRLSP